jgi:hypothetical protein
MEDEAPFAKPTPQNTPTASPVNLHGTKAHVTKRT